MVDGFILKGEIMNISPVFALILIFLLALAACYLAEQFFPLLVSIGIQALCGLIVCLLILNEGYDWLDQQGDKRI